MDFTSLGLGLLKIIKKNTVKINIIMVIAIMKSDF